MQALKKAATCADVSCFDELMRFDERAIAAVATEIQTLANQPAFKALAQKDLRPSGVFIKYSDRSDAEMFVAAWKDAAAGLNRILSVYGLGKDPRYKAIDRVSFDVSTEAYRNLLRAKAGEINLVSALTPPRTTPFPTPNPSANWLDKKLAEERLYPPPLFPLASVPLSIGVF